MSVIEKPTLYHRYLAMDLIHRRVEKAEKFALKGLDVNFNFDMYAKEFENPDPDSILLGQVSMEISLNGVDWSSTKEDAQEAREAATLELLRLFPEGFITRNESTVYFGAILSGVTVSARIGEAFCERVEVGTRETTEIDPEYLENAPMVKVVEPVYEYRCNDSVYGAMPGVVA